MTDTTRKILALAQVCIFAVGTIAGIGWALYNKAYFHTLCVALLAGMAVPQLVKAIKELSR